VAVNGRDEAEIDAVVGEIRGQGGEAIGVAADVTDSAAIERTRRFITEDQQREIAAMHPLGRLGTPEDVGLATLFLASESSSWLTGLTLDVAGGRIMA
jgi:3-oxoacyl-[acyl-carrier protein] reductase